MKMIMKEQANNLKMGAIYKHAQTDEPMRLVAIFPCQGVWMENATGADALGVKFEDVLYASLDEVQDFLEDLEVFKNNTLVKDAIKNVLGEHLMPSWMSRDKN